ncbi:siroheme synthase CysG [Alkalimarinus alittae]|uniref:Siroheme synthase n=1 Tax=Alkalimarinus alittae TaxID=2961619 RepID=A0ABY6N7B7_9ALTE|nr:siroheme synthase CysG [Alkalimarinus alittae]UZE97867.1 siroheme synthase CysG [Alkalimarinus alittae]
MDFLPLYFDLKNASTLVVGGGEPAARKIELLLRAGASVKLCASEPVKSIQAVINSGDVTLVSSIFNEKLLDDVVLVVAATGNTDVDDGIATKATARNLPVNVVNRAKSSSFIFPSIIDRSPIIASVSSSGSLPVLTRLLRSKLESAIPSSFGRLADVAGKYRDQVREKFPDLNQRRRFWEHHLEGLFAEKIFSGHEEESKLILESSLKSDEFKPGGEVYLVGAGPGDPDLLTFKALRLMRQADIVLYDRLVSQPILDLVRADAERVDVGKERANHTLPQQQINELLVTLAKQGKRVLRLKGGDPFIFGRGGEEIDRLSDEGIPFQVVPGITAASGCSSYAGIPLTHRDYSQSVRFVTGHLKDDSCNLPWLDYVQENQTLVFYMGLVGLSIICDQLIAHGMRADMPIALVSKGTTQDQKVVVGTLSTIPDIVKSEKVKAPTIIIIGEVVGLRNKLKWMN